MPSHFPSNRHCSSVEMSVTVPAGGEHGCEIRWRSGRLLADWCRRRLPAGRLSRPYFFSHGGPGALVLHPVQQPVPVVGADQRVPALRLLPVQHDDHLAVAPLLGDVGARIPDADGAAAVLPARDDAGEIRVVQRVVLGLHREPVVPGVRRNPLRHRPGHQHTTAFEPEVVVQAAGVVLLDDEGVVVAVRQVTGFGNRLRGLVRGPHGPVLVEFLVGGRRLRSPLVSCGALSAAGSRLGGRDLCRRIPTVVACGRSGARRRCCHRSPGPASDPAPATAVPAPRCTPGAAGPGRPVPPRSAARRRSDGPGRATSTARWWSSIRCSATSR